MYVYLIFFSYSLTDYAIRRRLALAEVKMFRHMPGLWIKVMIIAWPGQDYFLNSLAVVQ